MKEIILTEMNSTKSVCLHIPDLPCNSNGNTAIATSAFSPGKEKGALSGLDYQIIGVQFPTKRM